MRARALRQSGPPPRGSLNVHNAAEVWTIHAPDLKQVGSIETFRALLGTILGSLGFPVHWYGFGDDANRATAAAQSDPTHRSLEHDQGVVADMLLSMLEFQRDMSGGRWEEDGISLVLPELSAVDLGRVAQAMMPIITAGLTAGDAGLMTRQTLATMLGKLLRELDVEYDPAAELAEVDSQTLATAQADNDALAGAMGGSTADETSRLNGAQITATLEVLARYSAGEVTQTTAVALLQAVGMTAPVAQNIISSQTGVEMTPVLNGNDG